MTEEQNTKLAFKDFLDKSTNLITIFGVLNALFIYSSTIANSTAKSFLLPSFFVLSLLVWLEIIFFALTSNDKSFKYDIFYFLACSIELGLVIYFISIFSPLLYLLVVIAIWFLLIYFIGIFLVKMFTKWLSKKTELTRKWFLVLFFTIAVIISALILKLTISLAKPLVDKIPMENSIIKQDTIPK